MINQIKRKLREIAYQVRNFFYWGWKLRHDQNYDFGYLEKMLLMKLTAMRDYFRDYGHLSWCQDESSDERADWKALELTIKLLEKSIAHDNGEYILKNDLDKWGEWISHDGEGSILERLRPEKVVTEEDKRHWHNEWVNHMNREDRTARKYRKIMYRLVEKYGRSWWD